MEETTVTSKGQLTLPKKIREQFDIESGTKLSVVPHGEEISLIPVKDNPLENLREIREKVKFTRDEIESMISESKEKWSTVK